MTLACASGWVISVSGRLGMLPPGSRATPRASTESRPSGFDPWRCRCLSAALASWGFAFPAGSARRPGPASWPPSFLSSSPATVRSARTAAVEEVSAGLVRLAAQRGHPISLNHPGLRPLRIRNQYGGNPMRRNNVELPQTWGWSHCARNTHVRQAFRECDRRGMTRPARMSSRFLIRATISSSVINWT